MYARTVITSPTDELVFICSEVVISSFPPLTFQLPLALLLEEFNEESCLLQRTFNFRMFSKKSKRFVSKVYRRHRRECLRRNINYFRYQNSLLDYQM